MFTRTFGVEIEALAPIGVTRESVAASITAAGVPCRAEGYGHAVPTQWKIVTDGSIVGNGMEIVSPPLSGENGLDAVRKVCAVLTAAGFQINKTCGLHVHIDVRQLPAHALAQLAIDYVRYEPIIDKFMPKSRRASANLYCRSITTANVQVLASATSATGCANAIEAGNRYVKLNFSAFWRYGTVEFRHHSGTVDAVKATNWIMFCLRMVAKAAKATAVAVPVVGGRAKVLRQGTKLAIIAGLLARPEGCTVREVLAATGWPSVSMPAQAKAAGLNLSKTKERRYGSMRRVTVYRGVTAAQIAATAPVAITTEPATFETLAVALELTAAEREYWTARAAHFRASEPDSMAAVAA